MSEFQRRKGFCHKFRLWYKGIIASVILSSRHYDVSGVSVGKRYHMELWQAPVGESQPLVHGILEQGYGLFNREAYSL